MAAVELVLIVFLAAVANWQIVEIWHHGSIFAVPRAWLEVREGFLADLLGCPFCLSNWTAFVCVAAVAFGLRGPAGFEWHEAALLPVAVFAAARLSNLFNDLSRAHCRTPNRSDDGFGDLKELGGDLDVGSDDAPE